MGKIELLIGERQAVQYIRLTKQAGAWQGRRQRGQRDVHADDLSAGILAGHVDSPYAGPAAHIKNGPGIRAERREIMVAESMAKRVMLEVQPLILLPVFRQQIRSIGQIGALLGDWRRGGSMGFRCYGCRLTTAAEEPEEHGFLSFPLM